MNDPLLLANAPSWAEGSAPRWRALTLAPEIRTLEHMSQPAPPQQAASATPAGWYFDGRTHRWWDGVAWGQAAPDSNDRTLATLAHLGAVLGGFLLPLVLYLIADDATRPETRHHAREALNFQITSLAATLLATVAMFTGFAASGLLGASGEPEAIGAGVGIGIGLFLLCFAVIFAVSIASLVFGIIGAVRANKGIRYDYPLCIRFVRS